MSLPRRIIVTGAARGIGRAIAKKLLDQGCAVLLVDRNESLLGATCDALDVAHPRRVFKRILDLGDSEAIRAMRDDPWLADGLDGLVNNAVVQFLEPVENLTTDQLEATWKINMLAPLLLIQACLPALASRKGAIVNISSVAVRRPVPKYSLYAASKAFVDCLSRQIGTELGPLGIRINSLSPGGIQTELMDEINERDGFTEEQIREMTAQIPIEHRWGRPEEIADGVAFLLFGPRYLHGENLCIDGGLYP